MKVVRGLDVEVWRDFVDKHPAGNIFHTPEMFQVFARTKGHCPELWAAVDGEGVPLALLLPVQITLVDGLFRRFTTRAVVYGSVLCTPNRQGEEALSFLLQNYRQEMCGRILFTELRNLSDFSQLQDVLSEHGFVYHGHLNYLINLNRPAEDILQSIGKRTRKKIRKGLRDKIIQISEVKNRSKLGDWYETLRKTYKNVHVPLADRSMFEAAFDELYPRGMAKFILAKVDGAIAACSIELLYKDTIYGWYGGINRDYSKYVPTEMLIWSVLEWGANNGYCVYDFGGAGKPDKAYGVRDFKAKFHGELVSFGRNTCMHRRIPYVGWLVANWVVRRQIGGIGW